MTRWELLSAFWTALRTPERIGDIPILKSELGQVRGYPNIEAKLDAVRSYHPKYSLEELQSYPEGSFGRSYAQFMAANRLQPIIPSGHLPPSLIQRNALNARYASIHDMVHVLLVCDTSWVGECAVWGFVGGQRLAPRLQMAAHMAIWVAPFLCPHRLFEAIRHWKKGWSAGAQAQLLIAVRLEDHFGRSLQALRDELGVRALSV